MIIIQIKKIQTPCIKNSALICASESKGNSQLLLDCLHPTLKGLTPIYTVTKTPRILGSGVPDGGIEVRMTSFLKYHPRDLPKKGREKVFKRGVSQHLREIERRGPKHLLWLHPRPPSQCQALQLTIPKNRKHKLILST